MKGKKRVQKKREEAKQKEALLNGIGILVWWKLPSNIPKG